jgi:hypothetical protein
MRFEKQAGWNRIGSSFLRAVAKVRATRLGGRLGAVCQVLHCFILVDRGTVCLNSFIHRVHDMQSTGA